MLKKYLFSIQLTLEGGMIMDNYVFDNLNVLAGYIKKRLTNPTPLKIQKSLYFLWAFYSATYGNISSDDNKNGEFGLQPRYPKYLFNADFEAWQYGPVINSVYADYKNNRIIEVGSDELKSSMNFEDSGQQNKVEILSFINNLLDQIDDVNDFGLVRRTHQDSAWKDAFNDSELHCKMDSEQIKNDYIRYFSRS